MGAYLGHDTYDLIGLMNTGVEARDIGAANVFQTKCHVGADVTIPHHCSIGKQRSYMASASQRLICAHISNLRRSWDDS